MHIFCTVFNVARGKPFGRVAMFSKRQRIHFALRLQTDIFLVGFDVGSS